MEALCIDRQHDLQVNSDTSWFDVGDLEPSFKAKLFLKNQAHIIFYVRNKTRHGVLFKEMNQMDHFHNEYKFWLIHTSLIQLVI